MIKEMVLMNETFIIENNNVLVGYTGDKKNVVVPECIQYIDNRAFLGSNIESIVIAASVLQIGDEVFKNCKYLYSVEILDPSTDMGKDIFKNCISLRYIKIGEFSLSFLEVQSLI
jgi:hypothetical protein